MELKKIYNVILKILGYLFCCILFIQIISLFTFIKFYIIHSFLEILNIYLNDNLLITFSAFITILEYLLGYIKPGTIIVNLLIFVNCYTILLLNLNVHTIFNVLLNVLMTIFQMICLFVFYIHDTYIINNI